MGVDTDPTALAVLSLVFFFWARDTAPASPWQGSGICTFFILLSHGCAFAAIIDILLRVWGI